MTALALTHVILAVAVQAASGSSGGAQRTGLDAALHAFRAAHGGGWTVSVDAETGRAAMLYGGGAALGPAPREEREAEALARAALELTRALVGVEPETLELDRSLFLPLGIVGSGDKWTVRFVQRLSGLEVAGAAVHVLLDARGRLVCVQSTAVPDQDRLDEPAALAPEDAAELARAHFARLHGAGPETVSAPVLRAARVQSGGRRVARAAFAVDVARGFPGPEPVGERCWIDAARGTLLATEPLVHQLQVSGTVRTLATPRLHPDVPGNPETEQALKYARVQSAAGETTTDAHGDFAFPGVTTPLQVTIGYYGTYNDVRNVAGPPHVVQQTIQPGTHAQILLNAAPADDVTAQANAMVGVNRMRDWVRSVNPADGTADVRTISNVNHASVCNAFWGFDAINFYVAGSNGVSTCPNTSYSTVVAHELGHALNMSYGTGNQLDGMGEGNADVFAMYSLDTPLVGHDFYGPGTWVRSGLNTHLFCGDASPSCYGEPHADGEPWMGAAWKVRSRLGQSHGDALGDQIADALFLAWMNAFDQAQLRSIIESQWLTLDDDDGILANGTPHFTDIDGGFRDQGFPGVLLHAVGIAQVTQLPDTQDETGPYAVEARITANFSPPLAATSLVWRAGAGAWNVIPMTALGGDLYRASIPGQSWPALVQYYVRGVDSAGNAGTWPSSAPEQAQAFDVGTKHLLGAWSFDGATDAGWTSGAVGDATSPENDWARGLPQGRGGDAGGIAWHDPPLATSLSYAWANDLGTLGSDGAYGPNVHSFLAAPAINCSAAQNVRLRFQSWLTVEGNARDQARVLVNGTEVYASPARARVDRAWGMQELDISAVAAGNPSVRVEFRLRSDGAVQLGGWAIDDVEVSWIGPIVPPCPAPAVYCTTSPNSVGGGALMGWQGTGNLMLNALSLYAVNCPPGVVGQFYYGPAQAQVPFGNGVRCVGGTLHRLGLQTTDAFGDAGRALDLTSLPSGPAQSGQVWNFQFWYRNAAAGGAGFNLSDGLAVTICD